jgi:hypothetical protein
MHVQADEQNGAHDGHCPSLQGPTGGNGAAGLGRGGRIDFCGSTGLGLRSMYVFMVSVFLSFIVVGGVSPTTRGSAPFARCNPRLLRRADTLFAFIASHTV